MNQETTPSPPECDRQRPTGKAIVVVVEFHIDPEHVDRWLELALDHLRECVAEHGMLRFWVHRDDQDPAHFLFYEEWADRADFAESLKAAWRDAYHVDTEALWARPRVTTTYRRVSTPWEPVGPSGLRSLEEPEGGS